MKRINTTSPSLTVLLLLQPALSHSLHYIYNIFTASTQTYPTLSSTSIKCWLFYCSQKLTLSSVISYHTCYCTSGAIEGQDHFHKPVAQVAQESPSSLGSLIHLIHADNPFRGAVCVCHFWHSYCNYRTI